MTDSRPQCIFRELSGKRLLEIYDHQGFRSLYFGHYLQSRMSLDEPSRLLLPYTWYMMMSLLLIPAPQRVLLIGLGAGSLVRFLHHHFPHCTIDAVDDSEQVIKLAKGYFHFPAVDHVQAHYQNGSRFLADLKPTVSYDLILLDAYDEEGLVSAIYDHEAFTSAVRALSPEGFVVANLWSGGPKSAQEIDDTLALLLPGGLLLPVPDRGNIVSIRTRRQLDWRHLCRTWQELLALRKRFGLNFHKMVRVAMGSNLELDEWLRQTLAFAEHSVRSAFRYH